jgi:Fur family ferric uptake transcriptional regulator
MYLLIFAMYRRTRDMTRLTRQRAAIKEAFIEAGRPLSPLEVCNLANVKVRGLGIATVYRTITEFTTNGTLSVVELPGMARCYEIANGPHHHHFRCILCNRLFAILGCPGNLDNLVPSGFTMVGHEILLTGTCADCPKIAKVSSLSQKRCRSQG